MSCLLLRLAGPLQSWGYQSRFSDRDTGLEPSKSGVIGLLCCALGRDRSESPADLSALRMHVRVDRQGTMLKDFHTAGGGVFRNARKYSAPRSSGNPGGVVVTERHYLQDASFLVALEGDDERLLGQLTCKLTDPVWPLSLGRRSCPPSEPVLIGLTNNDAEAALKNEPLKLHKCYFPRLWNISLGRYEPDLSPQRLRLVLECKKGSTEGEIRRDVPVAWPNQLTRDYSVRFIHEEIVEVTPEMIQ